MTTAIPTTLTAGDVVLTRVLYLDALIDPEPTGLTPSEVRAVPWAEPAWAQDGQVRAAACAWVVRSGGRNVVIDPAGNIDDILHDPATTADHQRAFTDAFAAAGIHVASVDTVLLSHIESVGLAAVRAGDGWRPFFPNGRILVSEAALDHFAHEAATELVFAAYGTLRDAGLVGTFADGAEIAPGLHAEWTGAHNPGHVAFHVGDPHAPTATFVGHLAVTPLHLATGPCLPQHPDPQRAWECLTELRADGRWLVGPLWPSPGAGRWVADRFVAFVP